MESALRARDVLAFRVGTGNLADVDPAGQALADRRADGVGKRDAKRLRELQEQLWAEARGGESRRSLLLVLQGIDTSGKGGVTQHVVGACGTIGVQYTAFGPPTETERRHDFLWRIRRHVPGPGVIGVFDRSHYEDVLVPLVHRTLDLPEIEQRYATINEFEAELAADEVTIVKCFLHISYERQRRRLLKRLNRPDKRWKFHESDLDERELWPRYQDAFQMMLSHTDTDVAPWYVIPSDHKGYRNWAVAQVLLETLEAMGPRYPQPVLDLPALRARLSPPD
jgi:PPK2 family polyphosphate:nucleotide phosphotransferase